MTHFMNTQPVSYSTSFDHQNVCLAPMRPSESNKDDNFKKTYMESKHQELEKCRHTLNNLRTYLKNWDGYGALQPGSLAIKNARDFLRSAFLMTYDAAITWRNPHISPDSDGNIVLEWWGIHNRKMTFYVGSNEQIEYVKSVNDRINEMEDGVFNFKEASYVEFFSWLNY